MGLQQLLLPNFAGVFEVISLQVAAVAEAETRRQSQAAALVQVGFVQMASSELQGLSVND